MRILADENIPLDLVAALRDVGHDVAWVRKESPGNSDAEVLARASADNRVLLTFDKDFGELAFHHGLPASCGIVLLRVTMGSSQRLVDIVTRALASRNDWRGHVGCS